jgi:Ran GTPase-activating protein (RanGAP) involved in mRNA processing and transport
MINTYRLKKNLLALLSLFLLFGAKDNLSASLNSSEQRIAAKLAYIAVDPTRKKLRLDDLKISPESACAIKETLEKLPLTSLSLSSCSIDHDSLQMLFETVCSQSTITELDMSDLGIGSVEMEKFCTILRNNTTLRSLNFSWTPFVLQVVDALGDNPYLENLNLSFCAPKPGKATRFIIELTTSKHSLKQLSLSNNALTVVDVPFLQGMIRHHTNLQSLDLSGNKLEKWSECLLETALETKSITSLNLSKNNITNIAALSNYLLLNTALKELYLNDNELSTYTSQEIAWSLKQAGVDGNGALTTLGINGNKREFSYQDWELLAQGLENNTTLRKLDIARNGLHRADVLPMLRVLAACEYVEPYLDSERDYLTVLGNKISYRNRSYGYFVKALSLFIPARIENSSLRLLPHEQLSLIASYLVPFKNSRIEAIEKNGMKVAPDRLKKAFTLLLNSRWREQVMKNKRLLLYGLKSVRVMGLSWCQVLLIFLSKTRSNRKNSPLRYTCWTDNHTSYYVRIKHAYNKILFATCTVLELPGA